MGTSSPSGGANPRNPLIPSWIDQGNSIPSDQNDSDSSNDIDEGTDIPSDDEGTKPGTNPNNVPSDAKPISNRYTESKKKFNRHLKTKGGDLSSLKRAVKSYVKKGGGGSSVLAKRMQPATSRVVQFYGLLNQIKESGKDPVLSQLNLSSYANKPALETLSALTDEIFSDTGKVYEDTQDDSIAKQAYTNTINRICEAGVDLDNLTESQVEVMVATFIEETISQRVICDIGNSMSKVTSDIKALLEIEEQVYQIVTGWVRTQILPELKLIYTDNKKELNKKIENIYRIAFDAIQGTKE